jgi:hypothetical protein
VRTSAGGRPEYNGCTREYDRCTRARTPRSSRAGEAGGFNVEASVRIAASDRAHRAVAVGGAARARLIDALAFLYLGGNAGLAMVTQYNLRYRLNGGRGTTTS